MRKLTTFDWANLILVMLLMAALGLMAAPAWAQNTIIFTAEATTGVETVTPVLTWDTIPLAVE